MCTSKSTTLYDTCNNHTYKLWAFAIIKCGLDPPLLKLVQFVKKSNDVYCTKTQKSRFYCNVFIDKKAEPKDVQSVYDVAPVIPISKIMSWGR